MKMIIIFSIVIVIALAIALTIASIKGEGEGEKPLIEANANEVMKTSSENLSLHGKQSTLSKRISRFLAEGNPRAADHCHKDNAVCSAEGSTGSTCCNNKCVELETDKNNCGACKNLCEYTETCCRGKCVEPAFDKRHCGECNNKCMPGGYCIYGMCDYA